MKRTLVIYYSRKGQNYVGGKIVNLKKGNTSYVAEFIKEAAGADLFEVRTVKQYSADYTACTKEARAELKNKARPELTEYIGSIAQYQNIVVAGPCWWGTFPCAIMSQLERLDFKNKKVFAVMTHEGSGLGSSERTLKDLCQGAEIGEGLAVPGSSAADSFALVAQWAQRNLG
ncbi:MAG: NAD(P)H-dependent oxidoreductase [Succinivibrio sp.]|nr:NAD(P)H-dependent oxidoreductase [Succinivibrio sp.]